MKTAVPAKAEAATTQVQKSQTRLSGPQSGRLAQLAAFMNQSPHVQAQRGLVEEIQNSGRVQKQLDVTAQINQVPVIQPRLREEEQPAQRDESPTPNRTGLPDQLKSGVENLSGISLDDVKVHYNSAKPAQLSALAYSQGSDIHVAPGQETHLPHEAWHIVQQKQGRVRPTMQMKTAIPINDDPVLEKEADSMGEKALNATAPLFAPGEHENQSSGLIVQRFKNDLLIAERVAAITLPSSGFWGHGLVSRGVQELIVLLRDFHTFEDGTLSFLVYMSSHEKLGPLQRAIEKLRAVKAKAEDILNVLDGISGGSDGKGGYGVLIAELNKVKTLSTQELADMSNDLVSSQGELQQVFDEVTDISKKPDERITAENFLKARSAGILRLQMVKWWRSTTYAGHNAEVMISVLAPDGNLQPWAIAHVKWQTTNPILAQGDPYMYTFKQPDGNSMYGGNILNSSVQIYLLGQIMKHTAPTVLYTNVYV